jgi:hypothetical protein
MKERILILTLVLLVALAAGAGCAAQEGGNATPTPTVLPVTTAVTTAETPQATPDPLLPGPTVTSPPTWDTSITIKRNPSTYQPDIVVTYEGGSGNRMLQKLDIRVTRSDGVVKTAEITRPTSSDTIRMQTSVNIEGSQGNDRVEVTAWYNGIAYKIRDEVVPAFAHP